MDAYHFEEDAHLNIVDATAEIVAAYVANNEISQDAIAPLIQEVFSTLKSLGKTSSYAHTAQREPAVPIEESVTNDYIVCLEDGKQLKMLKRHLQSAYKMTPEQYRERWNLPADYPMVAPNYAQRRSQLAKNIGLGKSRKKKLSIAA